MFIQMEVGSCQNEGQLNYVYIDGGWFMLEWKVQLNNVYIDGGWFMSGQECTKVFMYRSIKLLTDNSDTTDELG